MAHIINTTGKISHDRSLHTPQRMPEDNALYIILFLDGTQTSIGHKATQTER